MELNGLSTTSIIKIGQVLRLPAGSSSSTSAPSPVTVSPVVPDGASSCCQKRRQSDQDLCNLWNFGQADHGMESFQMQGVFELVRF